MASPIEAKTIVDALPTPVLVLDPNRAIVAVNMAGVRAFTPAISSPVGKNFTDVVEEPLRSALGRAIDEAIDHGEPRMVLAIAPAPDAARAATQIRVQALADADGALAGVLVTTEGVRDSDRALTAQLDTANAELRVANEELERANREGGERTRFLAMLAHELRNPLAAINSALYLLRRRRAVSGDRTAEHALRIAERQAQSQARLLDDLLDASRLVLGKIILRIEPTDLVAIVRNAIDAAEFGIRSRAHVLRVELPDHPVPIMGDPVRLDQIVANLLGNAIKYTPPGGDLAIAVAATPTTATLTVTDTGLGIEPELLAHVFEPFTQGDTSRARAAEVSASVSRWCASSSSCMAARWRRAARAVAAARHSRSAYPSATWCRESRVSPPHGRRCRREASSSSTTTAMRANCCARSSSSTAIRCRMRRRPPTPYGSPRSGRRTSR